MKKFIPLLFLPIFAFAQDSAPTSPTNGTIQSLIVIGLALVFFYFILWRPEQKRRKVADQMRTALKKGDRVTAMGILGTVVRIQDQTVILKMVDGAKIEMLKAAITDVQPGSSTEEAEVISESN